MAKRKAKRNGMNLTGIADFREIIFAELERSGRSRYWLAHAVANDAKSKVKERTVYRYLSGTGDTTGSALASMFAVLGIKVVPKNS